MKLKVVVVIAMVTTLTGLAVGMAGAVPPTSRVAGNDRFETAAAIAASFPAGGPIYIATGASFPDALPAVPAAVRADAPVLLVTRDAVPPATAAILGRLAPSSIVAVGGPGAIGEGVLATLQDFTAGPLVRLAGGDRFATAAAVSATYAPGVPVVYIASGRDFPDALSAGAVAGSQGGPLLLTEPGTLPAPTAAELDRLDPAVTMVVGGTGAVSQAVHDQLTAYSPQITRLAGGDRYATSVAVSKWAFGSGSGLGPAYMATGTSFPDALAGAALAGQGPAPVLLSRSDCVPEPVSAEIDRLAPTGVILFGGTGALSEAVASLAVCQAPPPPPPPPPPTFVTFGDGTYRVGVDIPPGTYRLRAAPDSCYWERLSGFSGEFEDIIANDLGDSPMIVTIAPTDVGFTSKRCGTWSSDLSPLSASAPNGPFGDGQWMVGLDVAPGTWTAPGGDDCYWERISGFSGDFADLIANDLGAVNPVVQIAAADAGFTSNRCGTWTRIGS